MFRSHSKTILLRFSFLSSSNLQPHTTTPILLNGQFVHHQDNGDMIDSINPSTGETICKISLATTAQTQTAIKAARDSFTLFQQQPSDYKRSLLLRHHQKLLLHFAECLEKDFDFISKLETKDCGKPLEESKFDVQCSINCFKYYASLVPRVADSMMSPLRSSSSTSGSDEINKNNNLLNQDTVTPENKNNFFATTVKEPLGVAALITPFNYPLLMSTWKMAPALASGCCVIHKPAEQTCLSALRVAEYYLDFISKKEHHDQNQSLVLLNGLFQVLPGQGAVVGEELVRNKNVDKISFTGSTKTGLRILRESNNMSTLQQQRIKRVSLELGGKSPLVITKDADLNLAMEAVIANIFGNAGQICTASSRVFCDQEIHDVFVEKLMTEVESRLNFGENFGPVISKEQMIKVQEYIRIGEQEDKATRLKFKTDKFDRQLSEHKDGYFVPPTIFTNVTDEMVIAKEEIFGPVLCIMTPFRGDNDNNIDHLIERCNNSCYGLAAGIFASNENDAKFIERFCSQAKAGTIWVNEAFGYSFDCVPFGGMKMSGVGRELGGLENLQNEYMETKSLIRGKL